MSSFTNNLSVTFLGDTDDVRIDQEVSFYSETAVPGLVTTVYPGFVCDLDSIPEWIKSFVRASENKYKICYTFHDAWWRLYYYYTELDPTAIPPPEHELYKKIPYQTGDLLLDEALKLKGLGRLSRGKVYYGLKWFGHPGSGDKKKDYEKIKKEIPFISLKHFTDIEDAIKHCSIKGGSEC